MCGFNGNVESTFSLPLFIQNLEAFAWNMSSILDHHKMTWTFYCDTVEIPYQKFKGDFKKWLTISSKTQN